MSWRLRPRLAIKTAGDRARRRRSAVVLKSGSSCAGAIAVSLIRRIASPPRANLYESVPQKRCTVIRCMNEGMIVANNAAWAPDQSQGSRVGQEVLICQPLSWHCRSFIIVAIIAEVWNLVL
jgi:hypothetical protein